MRQKNINRRKPQLQSHPRTPNWDRADIHTAQFLPSAGKDWLCISSGLPRWWQQALPFWGGAEASEKYRSGVLLCAIPIVSDHYLYLGSTIWPTGRRYLCILLKGVLTAYIAPSLIDSSSLLSMMFSFSYYAILPKWYAYIYSSNFHNFLSPSSSSKNGRTFFVALPQQWHCLPLIPILNILWAQLDVSRLFAWIGQVIFETSLTRKKPKSDSQILPRTTRSSWLDPNDAIRFFWEQDLAGKSFGDLRSWHWC